MFIRTITTTVKNTKKTASIQSLPSTFIIIEEIFLNINTYRYNLQNQLSKSIKLLKNIKKTPSTNVKRVLRTIIKINVLRTEVHDERL